MYHLGDIKLVRSVASKQRAISAVIANWKALVCHLEDDAVEGRTGEEKATAQSLASTLKTYRFVYMLHFLADLFSILQKLSETFQRNDICISHVPSAVKKTIRKLAKLEASPRSGGQLEAFQKAYHPKTEEWSGVVLNLTVKDRHAG